MPLFYGIGYALQIWQLSKGQCDFNLYRNGLFDAFPLIWLGAALYRYRQTLDALPRKRLIWAFAVAFAALNLEILILHGSFAGQPADLMLSLYPLCGLGVLLLATSSLRIGTSYLARLSAAIYLVHGFVIVLLTPRLHGGETGDFLVTCLAATLLAVLVVCLNGQAHNRWLSLI
ncbi:MAG: hypothetical protein B7Y02_02945 [Rhodobacterales bacterium 17-64-5]|nr:MAG: hypothetical protein B7Y02_02945 [Rhodobacterales bacterium 17-64-5]